MWIYRVLNWEAMGLGCLMCRELGILVDLEGSKLGGDGSGRR